MCDYSIAAKNKISATKGQKLETSKFNLHSSTGFALQGGDGETAVCLLPGTELAFTRDIIGDANHGRVARFRRLYPEKTHAYHDHLEFANGKVIPIGILPVGLEAEVVQLPLSEALSDESTSTLDQESGIVRQVEHV